MVRLRVAGRRRRRIARPRRPGAARRIRDRIGRPVETYGRRSESFSEAVARSDASRIGCVEDLLQLADRRKAPVAVAPETTGDRRGRLAVGGLPRVESSEKLG